MKRFLMAAIAVFMMSGTAVVAQDVVVGGNVTATVSENVVDKFIAFVKNSTDKINATEVIDEYIKVAEQCSNEMVEFAEMFEEEIIAFAATLTEEQMAAYDEKLGQALAEFETACAQRVEQLLADCELVEEEVEEELIFDVAEEQPEFPGGMTALMDFLSENIKYPQISLDNGSHGRVIVRFTVNSDGSIQDVEVARSSGDIHLDNEAIRVVGMMPKWIPGRREGKPVRVRFALPVTFRLDVAQANVIDRLITLIKNYTEKINATETIDELMKLPELFYNEMMEFAEMYKEEIVKIEDALTEEQSAAYDEILEQVYMDFDEACEDAFAKAYAYIEACEDRFDAAFDDFDEVCERYFNQSLGAEESELLQQSQEKIDTIAQDMNDWAEVEDLGDYILVEEEIEEDELFDVVEEQPEFPGGMKALMKFLSNNIKYPRISRDNGSQGRVIVRFTVHSDGSIQDAEVVKSSGDVYLDKEAVRLVEIMPAWKPGYQSGKPVRVKFTLPVNFRLDGAEGNVVDQMIILVKGYINKINATETFDELMNVMQQCYSEVMKYAEKHEVEIKALENTLTEEQIAAYEEKIEQVMAEFEAAAANRAEQLKGTPEF